MAIVRRIGLACMLVGCGAALTGCIFVGPGRGYYHPHYYYGP